MKGLEKTRRSPHDTYLILAGSRALEVLRQRRGGEVSHVSLLFLAIAPSVLDLAGCPIQSCWKKMQAVSLRPTAFTPSLIMQFVNSELPNPM